jgi:hypothetical protein
MLITNSKTYDLLKSIAMIWLPAATTLYFAIASIWGIPDTTAVIGTMTAVDTCLGGVLGISSKAYTPPVNGTLVLDEHGLKNASFDVTAEEAAAKKILTLAVKREVSGPPA